MENIFSKEFLLKDNRNVFLLEERKVQLNVKCSMVVVARILVREYTVQAIQSIKFFLTKKRKRRSLRPKRYHMPHVWIGSELVFVINSISTGEAKLKVFLRV